MKKHGMIYVISFFGAAMCMLVIFMGIGIYPFGKKSILNWDLGIQYVDYFSYYKQILSGEASIAYSFSKSLGGAMISLIGYYLMSPLNLLIVFFEQEHFQEFILLITVLKVGLCGLTSSMFIKCRFEKLENIWVALISLAYALMQYNMAQLTNIMWLDGVYLLPIMMLAVWKFVSEKKKIGLSIIVAVSILFNWYVAYMNCLFIVLYYIYEQARWNLYFEKTRIKGIIRNFVEFCVYEGLGVLLSAMFFLPVIIGMRSGKGNFSFEIFEFAVNGSILDIFRGFIIGTPAEGQGQLSFFCGSFFLLNAIAYFWNAKVYNKEKIYAGIWMGIMAASSILKPLENVWNGFRFAYSYFCRFSYLVIIIILYLAAENIEKIDGIKKKILLKIAGACIILFTSIDYIKTVEPQKLWFEICVLLVIMSVLYIQNKRIKKQLFCVLICVELLVNGVLVEKYLYNANYEEYKNYVVDQKKLVESVEENETEKFYRIEQTQNRGKSDNRISAYLNENLSYGYNGIGHYSSSFDSITSAFVSNMGYSDVQDLIVYNEPILSSDSLLGVKYLFSDIPFEGWEKRGEYKERNEKGVYYNPFALSLGFKTEDIVNSIENTGNPFIYQNNIYSALVGEKVEIFKKATYNKIVNEKGISVEIPRSGEENILYGYGRFLDQDLKVWINGIYRCDYSKWLSYLVFNCGGTDQDNKIFFEGNLNDKESVNIEFYYLDMDLFTLINEQLKEKGAEVLEFEGDSFQISCMAQKGEFLTLTIPYDRGWEVEINGQKKQVRKNVDVFCAIELEEGENIIKMEYKIQGIKFGMFLSILSGTILAGLYLIQKKGEKRKKNE